MRRALIVLAVASCLTASSAHAVNEIEPPEITRFSASAEESDTSMFAQGTAYIGSESEQIMGLDGQGDHFPSALGFSGSDARGIAVWQPNAAWPGLIFAMSLWDLQVVVPEMTAWRWDFTTDDAIYRLEAVSGGLTADGNWETPISSIDRFDADGTFRLLGPCTTPAMDPFEDLNCPLITTLEGLIDPNSDRILWYVPTSPSGLFAVGDSIAPAPQGAVAEVRIGPNRYQDRIVQTKTYQIQGPTIRVGMQRADLDPALAQLTTEAVVVQQEGNYFDFIAIVDLTGVDRGQPGPNVSYNAVAQACIGQLCSTRATWPVTL